MHLFSPLKYFNSVSKPFLLCASFWVVPLCFRRTWPQLFFIHFFTFNRSFYLKSPRHAKRQNQEPRNNRLLVFQPFPQRVAFQASSSQTRPVHRCVGKQIQELQPVAASWPWVCHEDHWYCYSRKTGRKSMGDCLSSLLQHRRSLLCFGEILVERC